MADVNEKDWKLLRKKLPDWQEAYMDKLIHEYIDLLRGEGNPSDRFWALEKRIRNDKKDNGVMVSDLRRSNMNFVFMGLLAEGAITMDDLKEFSDELKARMARFLEDRERYAKWEEEDQ